MSAPGLYARLAEPRLLEALGDSPVVLIHGPRQSGKTTLARSLGKRRGYSYLSFDDDVVRNAAESDPAGFVDDLPARAILDEVQRVPAIFTTLKSSIDRRREAGRVILTGSAKERGARQIAGIEVKAAATVTGADFRGLRKLKDAAGARFSGGVVLYDGEAEAILGDGLHAVPLRCLWE